MAIQARSLSGAQETRLEKSRALLEAQIEIAIEVAKNHLQANDDATVLALTQALATNYAATVDAGKS